LDVECHGRGLRRPDARPARGHGGVAPAGRCGCANVGLLMGRPVTMCGGLWTSAFWPVRMRAVRREVVRVGRDAWRLGGAASPGKTPWFGCTVGMQLRTGFSRRKSRRLPVGGDDDGIRGCRSPYWGVILELSPCCTRLSGCLCSSLAALLTSTAVVAGALGEIPVWLRAGRQWRHLQCRVPRWRLCRSAPLPAGLMVTVDAGNRQGNPMAGIALVLSTSVTPTGATPLLGGDVELPSHQVLLLTAPS